MERIHRVDNETTASTFRVARDGRKITYKLKVLQQPERARACGSGAKCMSLQCATDEQDTNGIAIASADRRPVDPPPIVELRIFEGENEEKDVTFQLSANYFLFATLEQARPIAQGRVPLDPARATVLTGTPVAGMVYLDRPEPAGYFIFPDLSVRHEGKYRLGFSLYEELKDMKDADRIDENGAQAQGLGEAHVTHRLEVRSQPFIVYSAKKFPGLASSTSLSRTVAEQGCRVRIRRDVRMRRRDKPGKEGYDGFSDGSFERTRHSVTPDMYQQQQKQQQQHMAGAHGMSDPNCRERSASIASHVSLVGGPDTRRTSMQEMPQGYSVPAAYAAAPPAPQNVAPVPVSQAQYGGPAPQQYASQYQYQQAAMQPPPMPHPGYPYAQSAGAVSQQSYHYQQPNYATPMPQQYEGQQHARNHSIDYASSSGQDSRRSSTMIPPPVYQYGQQSQAGHQQYPPHVGSYSMAPTRDTIQASSHLMHNGSSTQSQTLPPLNTSVQGREKLEPSTPTNSIAPAGHNYYGAGLSQQQQQQQAGGDMVAHAGSKRGYDRVFTTEHLNAPLRQGARPSSPYVHGNGQGIDHEMEQGGMKMMYRRADGREIARPLPPSI